MEFRKCRRSCDHLIPGTKYHRVLICNRSDMQPGQHVMPNDLRKSAIPLGMFDLLWRNRCTIGSSRLVDTDTDANQYRVIDLVPDITQFKLIGSKSSVRQTLRHPTDIPIVAGASSSSSQYIRDRVAMITGKTFDECQSLWRHLFEAYPRSNCARALYIQRLCLRPQVPMD